MSRNTEETIQYLRKVLSAVNAHEYNREIFCDLSSIKELSVDAVMYLIAIIKNARHRKKYNVTIAGNAPRAKECADFLAKVGFYNFVRKITAADIQPPKDSILTIKSGTNVDPNTQRAICQYINHTTEFDRLHTRPLYCILGELMTNAVQHAYLDNQSEMLEQWYLGAEDSAEHQRFVFLDTGAGIPATARRSFAEKIGQAFINNDAKILESAFKGKFRTRTGQHNRGRGLPSIYDYCSEGLIDNMMVISGNGLCRFSRSNDYRIFPESLNNNMVGTLFVWDIKKGA